MTQQQHTYVGAALDEIAALRAQAVGYLREKLATRGAGLDQYDDATLIVETSGLAAAQARGALEQVGVVLFSHPIGRLGLVHTGVVVEADVRVELGLDSPGVRRMVTPLASRRVSRCEQ